MPRYAQPIHAQPAKAGAHAAARAQRPRVFPQRSPAWHALQLRAAQSVKAEAAATASSRSGLPAQLKTGVEQLSGLAMDDVRVHRDSPEPARLGALAYASGRDIHLGPGQERHLPHEAWHVVQQKQGRVRPTLQMKGGVGINDDRGLEQEADVMGAKALRTIVPPRDGGPDRSVAAAPALVQRTTAGGIFQLLFAVNPPGPPVALDQAVGSNNQRIMRSLVHPVGADPSDAIGFTGVLNEAAWAGLGTSPADYWRAHAYAKMFGGAGDETNVAWWPESSEKIWSPLENQVSGAEGNAQIADWLPGTGEQGTYLVEREVHNAVTLKTKYVSPLTDAGNWGFDDKSAAWLRTLATCDKMDTKSKEKRIALLKAEKATRKGQIGTRMTNWINTLFGSGTNLETNLISKLTMTYTITTAGVNAGARRAGFKKLVNAAAPNPAKFGLKAKKEKEIWEELVKANEGMFAQGNPPLPVGTVPYDEAQRPAQQLRAYADGWGSP
jgi:hypothetical protein